MTGEEFCEIHCNTHLREYILIQAKRRSKRKDVQEEAVQEAWLAISCAPSGCENRFYEGVARAAIYSHYWQERKQNLLHHTVDKHIEGAKHKTPERTMSDELRYKNKKDWRQ